MGDNGQGDVLCSELLAEGSGRRAGIRLTLINEVRPVPTTLSKFLKPVRPETCEGPDGNTTPKEWRELKIEIFSVSRSLSLISSPPVNAHLLLRC